MPKTANRSSFPLLFRNKKQINFIKKMDKRSIIGYILIGFVLIGFFSLNQPSAEDLEARKRYSDSIAKVEAIKRLEMEAAEQRKLQ